jgi:subtilisin family serine protease
MKSVVNIEEARLALHQGTGRGVKIAVIDSGIDARHPALNGLKLADDIAVVDRGHYLDVVPGEGKDLYGHGTAIAHIIHTIAPEAEIGSIRVLGERLNSRTAIIQEGARQALDRGYHILNCSFGCGIEEHVLKYKAWVDEAYLKGVHIVAACNNIDFQKPEWPGYFPSVFTVNFCHTDRPDQFFYQPGFMVEFAASGENVEVPWSGGEYKKVTGTSYATPHVVALLARLIGLLPDLSPLEAKALMLRIAEGEKKTVQQPVRPRFQQGKA